MWSAIWSAASVSSSSTERRRTEKRRALPGVLVFSGDGSGRLRLGLAQGAVQCTEQGAEAGRGQVLVDADAVQGAATVDTQLDVRRSLGVGVPSPSQEHGSNGSAPDRSCVVPTPSLPEGAPYPTRQPHDQSENQVFLSFHVLADRRCHEY